MRDSEFRDFNFSELFDPDLRPKGGPDSSWLYRLAYQARNCSPDFTDDFAGAMCWTLRPLSFESFQQTCGVRPIRWEEWYHEKLHQFFATFLYGELWEDRVLVDTSWSKLSSSVTSQEKIGYLSGSEPDIGWESLIEVFPPKEAEDQDWHGVLWHLTRAGEQRLQRFQQIIDKRVAARRQRTSAVGGKPVESAKKGRRRRSPHELRHQIILSALNEDRSRERICQLLDIKGIPTLASMQELRIMSWEEGWEDRDFRQSIQEMISRTIAQHGPESE